MSKTDLVDMDCVSITESHGFHYRWQRTVIDHIAQNLYTAEMDNNAEQRI